MLKFGNRVVVFILKETFTKEMKNKNQIELVLKNYR